MRSASEVLLASAARTATVSVEREGGDYVGVHVIIVVTADPAAAAITPWIEGYDEASGTWITLLEGAAINAVGTTRLEVTPYAEEAANVSARARLPQRWRFRMAVADTDSMTYSVGAWMEPA